MGAFQIVRELKDAKDKLSGFEVKETRYYESDTAFLRRVLGNRKGRGAAIIVFNDEAVAESNLSRWLDAPVQIADLSNQQYEFVGAGRCEMPMAQRSGHIMYRKKVVAACAMVRAVARFRR